MATPAFNPGSSYSVPAFDPQASYQGQAEQNPPSGLDALKSNFSQIMAPSPDNESGFERYAHGVMRAGANVLMHPIDTAAGLLQGAASPYSAATAAPGAMAAQYGGSPHPFIDMAADQTGAGAMLGPAMEIVGKGIAKLPDTASALAQSAQSAGKAVLPSVFDDSPQSLMTRAVRPAKNNVGWTNDVQTAVPLMKSAEQQLGRPIEGLDDALEANGIAKKDIWQQYKARLGPAAQMGATVDGNQIADAMMDSIDKRTVTQNPALADRIKAVADTYRGPMTVDDAEDFLRSNNAELNSYYAKNKVNRNAALADPETAYKVAEGDALRDALYAKLDDMTGPGAAQLKQAYGSLTNIGKELSGRKLVYERQAPINLPQQLSYLRAGGKIVTGDVLGGAKDIALQRLMSDVNDTNSQITRAFSNANPAQPFPAARPSPQPAGLLPSTTGGPFELPYVPEMSGGERLAALMHYLRQNPQLALPAKASPLITPPPE